MRNSSVNLPKHKQSTNIVTCGGNQIWVIQITLQILISINNFSIFLSNPIRIVVSAFMYVCVRINVCECMQLLRMNCKMCNSRFLCYLFSNGNFNCLSVYVRAQREQQTEVSLNNLILKFYTNSTNRWIRLQNSHNSWKVDIAHFGTNRHHYIHNISSLISFSTIKK